MERLNPSNDNFYDGNEYEEEKLSDVRKSLRTDYDIVFVGGGPATLSFFSHLIKTNSIEKVMSTLNVLIIEKSENFGSGCLGKYGINSNTSAEGFVRIISKGSDEESNSSEAKQGLSPNKHKGKKIDSNLNMNHSENNVVNLIPYGTVSNSETKSSNNKKVIPSFLELFNSSPCQLLLSLGSKPGPLPLIGNFLDCVGNFICHYIFKNYAKKIILLNSEVVSITVDKSNLRKITDYNYELVIKRKLFPENKNDPSLCHKFDNINIKTKFLILASGAKQKFDHNLKKELLTYINQKDFYHSDYLLQESGYSNIVSNLNSKNQTSLNPVRKVVIIGGSHSGFSCAWILLNGPADVPHTLKKSLLNNLESSNPSNPSNSSNSSNSTSKYKTKLNPRCEQCRHHSCCFGQSDLQRWKDVYNSTTRNNIPLASDIEISILYRDHIKVYYHSEKEALNDGYNSFDPKRSVNKNGNVYPFIGIRGDAKDLYRKIVKGQEKRVRLVNISNINEQKSLLQSSCAVIWAGGYTTEKIRILDKISKKELELLEDNNLQYEVDKELHLMMQNKVTIQSLMGIGQGYSTHSIEVLPNGKNARADSVNLYYTYIAKKLYRNIEALLVKEVFVNRERDKDHHSLSKEKSTTGSSLARRTPSNNRKEKENANIEKQETKSFSNLEKQKNGVSSQITLKNSQNENKKERITSTTTNTSTSTKSKNIETNCNINTTGLNYSGSNSPINRNENKNFNIENLKIKIKSSALNEENLNRLQTNQEKEVSNLNYNIKTTSSSNLNSIKNHLQVAPTYNINKLPSKKEREKENIQHNQFNQLMKNNNNDKIIKTPVQEKAYSNTNLTTSSSGYFHDTGKSPELKLNKRYEGINVSKSKQRNTLIDLIDNTNTNSNNSNTISKSSNKISTPQINSASAYLSSKGNSGKYNVNSKQPNLFKNPLVKSSENIYFAPILNSPNNNSLSSSSNCIPISLVKNRNSQPNNLVNISSLNTSNNQSPCSPSNIHNYGTLKKSSSKVCINTINTINTINNSALDTGNLFNKTLKNFSTLSNTINVTNTATGISNLQMPNVNEKITSGNTKYNRKEDFDIYIPHPNSLNNYSDKNKFMNNAERGSSLNSRVLGINNINNFNNIPVRKDKEIPVILNKSQIRVENININNHSNNHPSNSPLNTQFSMKYSTLHNEIQNSSSQMNAYSGYANSNSKFSSNNIHTISPGNLYLRRNSPNRKTIEARNNQINH